MNKRRGLGRGLDALIPSRVATAEEQGEPASSGALMVPVGMIRPNPDQPRRSFDPVALSELADSIREHGILQPLVVREVESGYELIAGERRLRAAQMAGLREVPVVTHGSPEIASTDRLELSLVENLQRADLDPIEEALAFRRLMREFGLSTQAIGQRVGRDSTIISHTMRLLNLPETVQQAIAAGRISFGHAKGLLLLSDPALQIAGMNHILEEGWSVRRTEEWARQQAKQQGSTRLRQARVVDADTLALEEEFRRALGTKVVLMRLRQGGRLTIEFYSNEELEAIRQRVCG